MNVYQGQKSDPHYSDRERGTSFKRHHSLPESPNLGNRSEIKFRVECQPAEVSVSTVKSDTKFKTQYQLENVPLLHNLILNPVSYCIFGNI